MEKNENIEMLTGDPKKAINKLSIPIIASMLLIFANNIIDSIWVAGLGAEPLAALGYITPLFMVLVGLGNGIGAGGNSLISRYIGANDKLSANNAAIHNMIIGFILPIVVSIILLIFLEPLIKVLGASSVLSYAMDYGVIIFSFSFAIMLPAVLGGAFRAEGDVKRATVPIALIAIINMIIDPIFIYTLNLGVAGAAWATVIAHLLSVIVMLYWMLIKKDTFLKYSRENFHNELRMYKDILVVGIPASMEQLMMSSLTIIVNYMLTLVAGPVAVAVYTAGWRIINLGMLPAIGVGTASISVAGVAFGAKKYENLKVTSRYTVKVALIASVIACILLNIFANQIAFIFSYSESITHLKPLIGSFIQIMCLVILCLPFGVSACNVFQGVGKGTISFILVAFRELVLVLIFTYVLGFVFNMGETGIYHGMLLGKGLGSLITYTCIELYINRLIRRRNNGA